MNLRIHGEHLELTDALQNYIETKVSKLEKFDLITNTDICKVTLRVVRKKHTVEFTIPTCSLVLRAEVSSDDMYKAIDLGIDKLQRQIRKCKTRVNRKARRDHGTELMTGPRRVMDEFVVRRQKRFEYKPMNVEEAILQMDLLGHNFFAFLNRESSQMNVVYKRKSGDYGLIETM